MFNAQAVESQLVVTNHGSDIKQVMRLKVLINPFGGQGKAKSIFERQVKPVFEAAKCTVDVQCKPTV